MNSGGERDVVLASVRGEGRACSIKAVAQRGLAGIVDQMNSRIRRFNVLPSGCYGPSGLCIFVHTVDGCLEPVQRLPISWTRYGRGKSNCRG